MCVLSCHIKYISDSGLWTKSLKATELNRAVISNHQRGYISKVYKLCKHCCRNRHYKIQACFFIILLTKLEWIPIVINSKHILSTQMVFPVEQSSSVIALWASFLSSFCQVTTPLPYRIMYKIHLLHQTVRNFALGKISLHLIWSNYFKFITKTVHAYCRKYRGKKGVKKKRQGKASILFWKYLLITFW